ncbi:MAG: S8 family serine peptidase [Fibrobacter sp.]|nr:S8 family serine peptidase [Fibrobacter sp.]
MCAKVSEQLRQTAKNDTSYNVWVYFTDKELSSGSFSQPLSRALARRKVAGYNLSADTDFPVNSGYIKKIELLGGKLRHVYKWENAASFFVSSKKIDEISKLPFVKYIEPVQTYRMKTVAQKRSLSKRMSEQDSVYGLSRDQLDMGSIIPAHEYMKYKGMAEPGNGVMIAILDGGFRLDHRCFGYIKVNNQVKAARDFVDNDTTVFDPDSVFYDVSHPYNTNDDHGTSVLALIAGHDIGTFMGVAWGAQFVLARTEDIGVESHVEEDNWVAALVWAESLGVDIVSSSLGYRYGFGDSAVIVRNGKSETVGDYEYSDLDGKTTIVSRAALMAVKRGLLIVNAIGNEGQSGEGSLGAPSDVDGVIAVGAIEKSGNLTWFSSLGPTFDGRMKPDLVFLGANVVAPEYGISSSEIYGTGMGTSFSAPIVSGICALLRQSHPELQPSQLRERLYQYCTLQPSQKSADNKYGRGVPNAVLSCMSDNEVFLKIKDTLGNVLPNVLIENQSGDSLGVTNHDGVGLLKVAETPVDLGLVFSGKRHSLLVDTLPFYKEFIIDDSGRVLVSLRNKAGKPVVGTVFIRFDDENGFAEQRTDDSGTIRISHYKEIKAQIYAKSSGYKVSDTVNILVCSRQCSEEILMEEIVLDEIPVSQFQLYPSIVKSGMSLKVRFILKNGGHASLSVRSVDGNLVWRQVRLMEPYEPFELAWNCRLRNGRKIVPGVYFFIVQCDDGKVYRKKFIISV